MDLKQIKIDGDDFDFFEELSPQQKIEFLCDSRTIGTEASLLKQLAKLDANHDGEFQNVQIHVQEIHVGQYTVFMTRIGDYITLNSDSLPAMRAVLRKTWLDGYILVRSSGKRTEWDSFKYFKSFNLAGVQEPLCLN